MAARVPAVWWCLSAALVAACAGAVTLLLLEPDAFALFQVSPRTLGSGLAELGAAAPLASVAANALTVVVPLPGITVAVINGTLFGPLSGAFLNWVGGLAGAALCFWVGRRLAAPFVRRALAGRAGGRPWVRRLERPSGLETGRASGRGG